MSQSNFTHLHVHSHYSLLDGLTKIPDLVSAAKERGMDALALTDHGTMYGSIEFYRECKSQGIKPIIGMEAYLARGSIQQKKNRSDADYYHLILLAKNLEGYKNLMKLTTKAHLEGYYYKPRIDKKLLSRYSDGLICLSGCLRGEVARALAERNYELAKETALEYRTLFGKNNFYLEVQKSSHSETQRLVNQGLVELSRDTEIPLVATADSHYLTPDDSAAQDILVCVGTGKTVDEPNRLDMRELTLHLKTSEEMAEDFSDLPEAIENTEKIAEMVELEMPLFKLHFPSFPIPEGESEESYLKMLCFEGIAKRYQIDSSKKEQISKKLPEEVLTRLNYELDTIVKKGYATYFLVVADFVSWARRRGIIATTRGSAAGSLVAYALEITAMNPIEYKLPFERFLNPFRPSPPDIDMDFADNRRDEVLQYVSEKYGRDKVAQIVTFGTMMARAAIRDVGRALGLPYSKCDKVAKMIPFGKQGFHMSIDRALELSPDLKKAYNQDPETKNLIELAKKVEGSARHASVHAAGVVIAPTKLTDFTPLQLDTDNKHITTQYDMHSVEAAGLVKMDFLGIRNLSILGMAVEIVGATKNVNLDLQSLPLDDQKTYDLLASGRTLGVFQLGGSGMTRYLVELKPTNIFDIMAMVSLYRPGPMDSIPEFIARKQNPEQIEHLDPRMKELLDMSYGVITYQEDVLLIAINLAGYTWEEADKLRKAMGKKIPKEMAAQKEKFIQGAISGGMSSNNAVKLWSLIEPFAAYGFGKAHAASYAIVAYQTAYLKANYPVEFMAAVMTAESHDNTKVAAAVNECKNMGIEVLPPDVNESLADFTVVSEKQIRFGLSAIKNLGSDVIASIIRERKNEGEFHSLADFTGRVKTKNFNKKSWEALVKSGALDRFGERNEMLENTESVLEYARAKQKQEASGQSMLFAGGTDSHGELKLKKAEPATEQEKLAWEKELLGLYVSSHPLNKYQRKLEELTQRIAEITVADEGQIRTVGGIITRVQNILTKKGDQMCFTDIEDLSGTLELVIFPNIFQDSRQLLEADQIVLVRGKISDKDGEIKLLADSIIAIDDPKFENWVKNKEPVSKQRAGKPAANQHKFNSHINTPVRLVKIQIPEKASPEVFQQLKTVFQKHPGNSQVALVIPDREGTKREIKTDFTVKSTDEFKGQLREVLKESIKS